MVGYEIENTLTENGFVSRGVCETDASGMLTGITERTKIRRQGEKIVYTDDDGAVLGEIPRGQIVSMNFWGFTPDFFTRLDEGLKAFLTAKHENPLKAEFFLPEVADNCIRDGYAEISVLTTNDKWYGVTYKEDSEQVSAAIAALTDSGLYPEKLWD